MEKNTFNFSDQIKNIQHFLRKISYHDERIPYIIPDGDYNDQTQKAIAAFQKAHGLEKTGDLDEKTQNKIKEIYNEVIKIHSDPSLVNIFPHAYTKILPGEYNENLKVIQAMLQGLTKKFTNLGSIGITGVNDTQCSNVIKNIQKYSNLEPTGIIDKQTWDHIAQLYSMYVSQNRVDLAEATKEINP